MTFARGAREGSSFSIGESVSSENAENSAVCGTLEVYSFPAAARASSLAVYSDCGMHS